tara:strand:- start:116019 stop:117335 length:1317 start_codon:yes stop_codon:yes gene_type:complete
VTFESSKLLRILKNFPKPTGYLVSFSGGLDSHVLLHSIKTISKEINLPIRVIHLNHNLHQESDIHENHCKEVCSSFGFPFLSFQLDLKGDSKKGLEAFAREKRYSVIADNLKKNEMLLLAHHRDDQVETLFLQLLRGSGVAGLSGMPKVRNWRGGWQARPLLNYSKDNLRDYGIKNQLKWVEDPSNKNQNFDRNYIRGTLLPIVKKRWKSYDKTVNRSISHISNALILSDEVGNDDLKLCLKSHNCLSIKSLKKLSFNRRCNAIRFWIKESDKPVPNTKRLLEINQTLLNATFKSSPRVDWGNNSICSYRDSLWITDRERDERPKDMFSWPNQDRISLPKGQFLERTPSNFGIPKKIWDENRIRIGWRSEGLKCKILGRYGTRSFKKICQELEIPPWNRNHIPLIFIDNEIAAVADYFFCEHIALSEANRCFKIYWSR